MTKISFEMDYPPSDCLSCPLSFRDKRTYYAPSVGNAMTFAESNTIIVTICRLNGKELHSPIKLGNKAQGCGLVINAE